MANPQQNNMGMWQTPANNNVGSSPVQQQYQPVPYCTNGRCGTPQVLGYTGLPELQPIYSNIPQMQMPQTDNSLTAIDVSDQPSSINSNNIQYLNGFLRTQIGRKVLVEFLIGTNTLVDRTGILLAVGANYILINEYETDDIIACDFYNIKFIKFFY